MAVDKAGLLKAVAEGGSQGRTVYQQQMAQLTDSQNNAIREALSSTIAQNAPAEAGGILGDIIERGYAPGIGAVGSLGAATAAHGMSTQAALKKYLSEMAPILQMATTQYQKRLEEELAAAMAEEAERAARSGGGGGGGGGGSGDWWDALEPDFDTKSDLYNWIGNMAGEGRTPGFMVQRGIASELGIPEMVAETRFQPDDWTNNAYAATQRMVAKGKALPRIRRVIRSQIQDEDPAERVRLAPDRRWVVDQAKLAGAPKRKQAKKARKAIK